MNWSEQRVDSSLAALIIAATPIWSAIVIAIMDKKLPKMRMVGALVESISIWTLAGAVLILLGVSGVFRERYREDT